MKLLIILSYYNNKWTLVACNFKGSINLNVKSYTHFFFTLYSFSSSSVGECIIFHLLQTVINRSEMTWPNLANFTLSWILKLSSPVVKVLFIIIPHHRTSTEIKGMNNEILECKREKFRKLDLNMNSNYQPSPPPVLSSWKYNTAGFLESQGLNKPMLISQTC